MLPSAQKKPGLPSVAPATDTAGQLNHLVASPISSVNVSRLRDGQFQALGLYGPNGGKKGHGATADEAVADLYRKVTAC